MPVVNLAEDHLAAYTEVWFERKSCGNYPTRVLGECAKCDASTMEFGCMFGLVWSLAGVSITSQGPDMTVISTSSGDQGTASFCNILALETSP